MTVYLIGRMLDHTERHEDPAAGNWSVEGIYDDRSLAEAAAEEGWFIATVPLNEALPEGSGDFTDIEWVGHAGQGPKDPRT